MTDVPKLLRAGDDVVLDGMRRAATTAGDRPFLTAEETGAQLTYTEFDSLVRRVANGFADAGLARGDRVSVLTRNPLTAATAMFGLWRGGFVYSPVNFNLSGDTLAYQLADTRAAAIICQDDLLPALAGVARALDQGCTIVVDGSPALDTVGEAARSLAARHRLITWDELTDRSDAEPDVERRPDDPANIIYTSGTTGHPKGVVQPYRWMNQYTFFKRNVLTPDDVIYNDLPLYHIGGAMFNVAVAAWAGASVAVWERFSASDFWGRVNRVGATTAVLLDVMIPWLMSAAPSDDDRRNPLNKVQLQPLPLYHNDLARRFGIDWVTVGFGQTESGCVSFALIDELDDGQGTPAELHRGLSRAEMLERLAGFGMPVVDGSQELAKGFAGRPVPYFDVAVLTPEDEAAPGTARGEIAMRPRLPHLLLQEYFGRPDATMAANRNHWFHTGDIGYFGDDGSLYWVDRAGDRIRTRGENVSSSQVEDLINKMPDVAMSAVFPVPSDEGLEHDIAAFVVPNEAAELDEAALTAWIADNLPRFMRPRHHRIVEALPRTPTNKVEKYKLRSQLMAELAGAKPDATP